MKSLCIIIPASNEERFIKNTIKDVLSAVKDVKLVIVCNNCHDKTFSVVEKLRKRNKNIINVNIKERIGKGGAILEGFKHIGNSMYVGYLDADNAFYTDDILKLANELKKYDCVIASKWLNNNLVKVNETFFKKFYGRIWNLIINLLFKLNVKDSQAGMKFFRRDVLDKINTKDFICKGFDFDVELLHKIKKNGFSIKEVGVKIRKLDKKSSFSYRNTVKMLINVFRYWYLNIKKV